MSKDFSEDAQLAAQFEGQRPRLRAMAYRMLGSIAEAEDAVQDTWIRLSRSDANAIENLGGWLTTVTARVCLNLLEARAARPEDLNSVHLPDPIVAIEGASTPEDDVLLTDSVGLALMIVLDTLNPAERLAFVFHDMFDVPFDDIATIVERTPTATRQLASRARRRLDEVRASQQPSTLDTQHEVVNAFFSAARKGDFDALVAVLDPNVELRADGGATRPEVSAFVQGAKNVAGRALMFAQPDVVLHGARINGEAGVVGTIDGTPIAVMAFLVVDGHVAAINAYVDPQRLAGLDLAGL
jgi:RNA polymerase sigma factor (sigma-70 family)